MMKGRASIRAWASIWMNMESLVVGMCLGDFARVLHPIDSDKHCLVQRASQFAYEFPTKKYVVCLFVHAHSFNILLSVYVISGIICA